MNFGDMQEYVQRMLMKGVNVDVDLVGMAINLAMQEIQTGTTINGVNCQHDWTANAAHYVLPYQLGGIVLENALSRVRAVYQAHVDPVTKNQFRGRYIQPSSTEARDNRMQGQHHHFEGTGIQSHGTGETWWVQERRLMLGHGRREISGGQCTDKNLWLDVFRLLDPLVNTADENWFTVNLWDAIAYKAAAIGFQNEFDPKRMELFNGLALERIKSVIDFDQRFSDGGVAEDVVPTSPHLFREGTARRWEDA
jgi:hypothetical protein